MLVMVMVLLNMLVAILMEAYGVVKEDAKNADSLPLGGQVLGTVRGTLLLGVGEYTNPTRDQTNLVRDCLDPSSFLICTECTPGSEHSKNDGAAGMSHDGICSIEMM